MEYVTLSNGVKMQKLGFGVFQIPKEDCERCVLDAIKVGYRHIDTAQSYFNEEEVGNAIEKCGVPREELFPAKYCSYSIFSCPIGKGQIFAISSNVFIMTSYEFIPIS